jgi:hypothetical protein
MDALRKLGFSRGWIYETIVTIRSAEGVNAAPMGVWSADGVSVSLRIHKTAQTLENIRKERKFVINFPDDVGLFYDAILGKNKLLTEGDTLFLDGCPAALEAEVTAVEDMGDAAQVTARILSFRMENRLHLMNRAEYLALDSLIAHTKLQHVSSEERKMLTGRIRENLRVIRGTAPGSEFQKQVERLLD